MHIGPQRHGRAPGGGRAAWLSTRKGWLLLLTVGMITGALASGVSHAADGGRRAAPPCDETPTGAKVQDRSLRFAVPRRLVPDAALRRGQRCALPG